MVQLLELDATDTALDLFADVVLWKFGRTDRGNVLERLFPDDYAYARLNRMHLRYALNWSPNHVIIA